MDDSLGMDFITILKITQTSEHFLKLDYISSSQGLTYGLLRQSKKNKNSSRADLFDTAEILKDVANHSNQRFIKNYTPIHKRSEIGSDYQKLSYASHFANFILDNFSNVPDPSDLYNLTTRTLDAFEKKYQPEIVSLKALYCFLKNEGFPVDSGWWQSLSAKNKSIAKILLTKPLSELEDNTDLESALKIYQILCEWVQKETEIKIKALFL